MNILWFSWKDIGHPLAGGAELLSDNIRVRLAKDGHQVTLITAAYTEAKAKDSVGGVEVIRLGGRFSVYPKVWRFFRKNLKDWPDLIVDEMNTLPFGCAFYSSRRSLLLAYQLARQVWFYQIAFPVSAIGYLLEPVYLFCLSMRYKLVLTESESTRQDLCRFGFNKEQVKIFRAGITLEPIDRLSKKTELNKVLILGAVRPMKRTLSAVKAFEHARDKNQHLQLIVAGSTEGSYGKKVLAYIKSSRHNQAIDVKGFVSSGDRLELMKQAAVILVTSIKEGWGLIVTEAASQGTPAIVYDIDGLRDSVQDSRTGILVPSGDEKLMGSKIVELLSEKSEYEKLRQNAWNWSKQFTLENSYSDFLKAAGITS